MPDMTPCHPKWFDIKLDWAKRQPGFACVRDGTTLEYHLDGKVLLRVVKVGERAELWSALGEVQKDEP